METQSMIEFPHENMDRRPRKRPRLTWDMPPPLPPPSRVLPTINCDRDFKNGAISNYGHPALCYSYKGIPHNGSPPWRLDDKDGHYVFAVGENLTPRSTSKSCVRVMSGSNASITSHSSDGSSQRVDKS